MKKLIHSKKLIVIVAVVLVGILAVVFINNKPQQDSDTTDLGSFVKDNGRASLMADASQPSGQEFVFQQLGVTIDQPKGLKGLDYVESPTLQKSDGRLYVTSEDFKVAAKDCGEDPEKNYFASVFIATSPAYDNSVVATVDGKKIAVGPGSYELACSGDASTQKSRVLKESTELFKEALKSARPVSAQ